MRLDDIVKDPDIYPRPQISHQTVENYAGALKAGARFPPILVQRISDNGTEKTVVLDGFHRMEAYKKAELDEIGETSWRDGVLDKKEWLERLRIVSLQCNLTHGDRAGERDLQFQSLRIVAERPIDRLVGIVKELANEFGITEGYMSQLIGPEVNRRRQSRDALAYRLHLLGWTEREIGKVVGVKNAHDLLENFNAKLFLQEYQSGLTPEQIATNHNLDEALVWAILLEGKDDLERFKLFGNSEYGDEQPKLSDYWKFSQRDPRLGVASYPGNLYGQEVLNILYRYTKQGDLVVDPMAGGGTTIDACLVMNRRCLAYDSDPGKSGRDDIRPHDIRQGFPPKAKACDLIILDPPYYKKNESAYGGGFTKDRQTFIDNIRKLAEDSYNILRPAGCVALLYGQYIDYEDEAKSILSTDLCALFEERNKFRPVLRIQSPLTLNNQWDDFDVERAKSFTPWRILPVSKDWQIFKKV